MLTLDKVRQKLDKRVETASDACLFDSVANDYGKLREITGDNGRLRKILKIIAIIILLELLCKHYYIIYL